MEIGVDLVDISEFEGKYLDDKRFIEKIFTETEIQYCMSRAYPAQHFAARFAAKEAVIKAVYQKFPLINYNEIEVTNDKSGRPYVKLLFHDGDDINMKISLSHSKHSAIAFVVLET